MYLLSYGNHFYFLSWNGRGLQAWLQLNVISDQVSRAELFAHNMCANIYNAKMSAGFLPLLHHWCGGKMHVKKVSVHM